MQRSFFHLEKKTVFEKKQLENKNLLDIFKKCSSAWNSSCANVDPFNAADGMRIALMIVDSTTFEYSKSDRIVFFNRFFFCQIHTHSYHSLPLCSWYFCLLASLHDLFPLIKTRNTLEKYAPNDFVRKSVHFFHDEMIFAIPEHFPSISTRAVDEPKLSHRIQYLQSKRKAK